MKQYTKKILSSIFVLGATNTFGLTLQELFNDLRFSVSQTESLKPCQIKINELIDRLEKSESAENLETLSNNEAELRTTYVGLQSALEHLVSEYLLKGKVKKFVGIIHTPLPATPLCMDPESIHLDDLIEESMRSEGVRYTVRSREKNLSILLSRPNVFLHNVFSINGREKRGESIQFFDINIAKFKKSLFPVELIGEVKEDLVGASYFIVPTKGQAVFFSIGTTQANKLNQKGWKMWIAGSDSLVSQSRWYGVAESLKKDFVGAGAIENIKIQVGNHFFE